MPTVRKASVGWKRKNDTVVSTSDPDARLYRKAEGQTSRLCYMNHALIENRSPDRRRLDQLRERLGRGDGGSTAGYASGDGGADKNYDTQECVDALRRATAMPHVAQNDTNHARRSRGE